MACLRNLYLHDIVTSLFMLSENWEFQPVGDLGDIWVDTCLHNHHEEAALLR